eukprot:CAMPEP_0168465774 /NCGR_PEP_ID=MMETSP0228-20121227/56297_1 /TAXON_ID=133427 /ORGANISM="Protoceratium reticulatum, Strain CCCM 535 (=CCMP 1889)" /LENGTH=187 /DNA_ID=CAMNT_0008481377 /DNA_START=90 /DNA_END=650 /DNA_ORIENTATION=+
MKKRLSAKYDIKSKDFSTLDKPVLTAPAVGKERGLSLIEQVDWTLSQRSLKSELLACLYHRGRNFISDYEYTSAQPQVIGSGFSGDVVLCRRRERLGAHQNKETSVRCVKTFNLQQMGPDRHEKLKNEAAIYLSLEHPHIARLFDVYEDVHEVSLVMQYCSGGTLEDAMRTRGAFSEGQLQEVAVPM